MTTSSKQRNAEIAVAERSKILAEHERQFVSAERLDGTIRDFIYWRAFSYWVRLAVDHDGLGSQVIAILDERCPGFLEYMERYEKAHPEERPFLWLRLITWIDEHVFASPKAESWRHALGYYAARDPLMARLEKYWARCDEEWKIQKPEALPSFEIWHRAASEET
ncbi:MAG: hypothetical protein JWO80_268 [Bryobacterales bacterium]|nr:hypothetical protein [Bryobacterales bacterium]